MVFLCSSSKASLFLFAGNAAFHRTPQFTDARLRCAIQVTGFVENIPYLLGRPDWETVCISFRNVQNKFMN